MHTVIEVLAGLAILANAVIYGTDVFGALALIIFLAIYNRFSKPVNTALTAASLADRVPGDARQLQARWDSVINARVALQTLALAALCAGLAAA